MDTIQSIIVGVVEGLTEFLPVSSTGHMIITEKLLHIAENDFSKVFTIAIQLGAILAVVVLYWKKFFDFKNWKFYLKIAAGVVPALILGFLFSKKIDALLESSTTVAISLLAGGIILLFIDNVFKNPQVDKEEDISFFKAIMIGIWQCIAMIPGISRSAASIIGGMQQKLTRSAAAEFSFFLAVPTMLAATGYKLLKYWQDYGGFSTNEIKQLAIGNIVAFVVAMLAIKFFIGFLKKHGFKIWGYYRIVVGIILLILIYTGYIKP
ncbi:MAG: undecaprenyl-diphosphate phosphatase [Ferruginibacter sp.]|nr:undecaprenyl-diphosphate phosphatase [Bacteroidota bacterium]MBX2917726.1 undecaprenyl-diphosphate phosphatase [Ferruginibacter sp.]MCB0710512.1 undecaprenyl-diphosphate phosphatase [Chitinophagaceae bacterium]MCC7378050.1 undecaprenyl-diphosphate phosphatase [Chitinophagaceae bacterium]